MKKTILSFPAATLLVIILLFNCCKKKELPQLLTSDVTEITESSATSGGVILSDGGEGISAKGVCWSTDSDPTIDSNKKLETENLENFVSKITDLNPNTTYYIRAFAINAVGTGYGSEISFKTLGDVPAANDGSATEVSTHDAILNGIVNANNLSTSVLFEYGLTNNYGQTAAAVPNQVTGNSTTNVSASLTGLLPNTTYHFRIKAQNSLGIIYSNDFSFKTLGNLPTVTTNTATSISVYGASLSGSVNPNRLSTVVSFEYGLTENYDHSVNTTPGTVTGNSVTNVVATLTGLSPNTTYHFRIKAENELGISYGNDVTVTTLPVTDIDGFTYETVVIGTQIWLKDNLKTTRYRDGSVIPLVPASNLWQNLTTGAYSSYDNNNAYVSNYGALYNWYAVTDPRGLCPLGWHVPTNDEWAALINYLGGLNISGGKMKETGTQHWLSPNTGASNSSGFTGIGSGFRDITGIFTGLKQLGYLWSSTEYSSTHGMSRKLFYDFESTSFSANYKQSGFAVRCIMD